MDRELEHELETELGELEGELGEAGELEGELGELEGEGELGELEQGELEGEQGEQFIGGLLKGLMGGDGELEQGEQFFGKLLKRAMPLLKRVGRAAIPAVTRAVGGAIGGPAGQQIAGGLGQLAQRWLREAEQEAETELEASHELGEHEAAAEMMASAAAEAASELEAEAHIGAATTLTISARDRQTLRRFIPQLVRGSAVLTRILRARPTTRPFVRVVPTVVRRTVRVLRRCAASGRPVNRRRAALAMGRETARVLGNRRLARTAMVRSARATRRATRPAREL